MNRNILLVILAVTLAVIPLAVHRGSDFAGADGKAEEVITEINPNYIPRFKPIWEPPGGEIESLLFALQAALGSGFIGYYFGYKRGKRKGKETGMGVSD